jgi:hypothetical protein
MLDVELPRAGRAATSRIEVVVSLVPFGRTVAAGIECVPRSAGAIAWPHEENGFMSRFPARSGASSSSRAGIREVMDYPKTTGAVRCRGTRTDRTVIHALNRAWSRSGGARDVLAAQGQEW